MLLSLLDHQEDQGTRGLEQVRRVVYQRSVLAKNVEFWGILLGFVPMQWMHHLERRKDGQQPMLRRMQQQGRLKMQWRMQQQMKQWRIQQQMKHLALGRKGQEMKKQKILKPWPLMVLKL
nr:uncharacterized protein LOC123493515 [Aegilops tauschii subsp. strangulata]